MVITAAGEAETMTTVPERSRTLHNFSSLPCFNVKWGRQKQLRCVKDSSSAAGAGDHDLPTSSSSPQHHQNQRRRPSPDFLKRKSTAVFEDDGGIEAMREKLMLEIRTEVHQMKATLLSDNAGKKADDVVGAPRPWNLRSRRAVCKEPMTNDNTNAADGKPNFLPAEVKSMAEIGGGDAPRAKFSASLSKREIEEDFLAILGTRPARRPRKRPRYVQKQIDALFPGYWLSEITADMYKVNENPEAGKR
uniref:DUF1639 family protein n=1 Tax=Opuntia streptacantha TaxID=393608 RepID=A0A7C9AZW8_OPUST